jgi:hypothetical protein
VRGFVLAAALLALAGCSSPATITLDGKWSPLTTLRADPSQPDGVYSTDGATCYVKTTADFLSLSTEEQNGLLLHESLHSMRQFAYPGGPVFYLKRYSTDGDFLRGEELAGWEVQIRYDASHGVAVDPAYVATFMSTFYRWKIGADKQGVNVFGYNEILEWVKSLVADAKAVR